MRAYLKNYRQAPRKVRLVTDLIKGKSVVQAKAELQFLPKRASGPILKLLNSAVTNAKIQNQNNPNNLVIKDIQVNKGTVLKRMLPTARGRATQMHKHSSHIKIELGLPAGKVGSKDQKHV